MQLFGVHGWVYDIGKYSCRADGIMLEVHPDPKNSAVDPLQPINFEEFENLTKKWI